MISLIAAVAQNGVIGKNGGLPWHLPEDLKYFKKLTMGHWIVMGRKTFASIGKPLPGRKNIVLTRDRDFRAQGVEVFHNLEHLLERIPEEEEVFVIGGADIFRQFLPYADMLYFTQIAEAFEGDTFFPSFDLEDWELISRQNGMKNKNNPYHYAFLVYERKRN